MLKDKIKKKLIKNDKKKNQLKMIKKKSIYINSS
jgi:hypothetical protein